MNRAINDNKKIEKFKLDNFFKKSHKRLRDFINYFFYSTINFYTTSHNNTHLIINRYNNIFSRRKNKENVKVTKPTKGVIVLEILAII